MKYNLTIIVFISFGLLIAAAVMNFKTKKDSTKAEEKVCTITVEGFIKKDTTGFVPRLVFISKDNRIFEPIIETSGCILTENTRVQVCATSIDVTDSIHKTIHINKVVFLP